MNGPTDNTLRITIGPFNNSVQTVTSLDFVIHYDDNTWDNNNSSDYHITISDSCAVAFQGQPEFFAFPNPGRNIMPLQNSGKENLRYSLKI